MRDLYEITAKEAIDIVVNSVLEYHPELSKNMGKNVVINSLCYNCVIAEIRGQVDYLLEDDSWLNAD